jgi:hypothetical protein
MTFTGQEFLDTARRNPHYWRWMTEAFGPEKVAEYGLPIVLVDEPEVIDLRDGADATADQPATTDA